MATKRIVQNPKADKPGDNSNTQNESTLYEQGDADWLRYTLSRSAFYPTGDMRSDPAHDLYEKNVRENVLPALLERLDRNDLEALHRMAEALAIYPVFERFWENVENYQRERMQWLVESGQVPKKTLATWEEAQRQARELAASPEAASNG